MIWYQFRWDFIYLCFKGFVQDSIAKDCGTNVKLEIYFNKQLDFLSNSVSDSKTKSWPKMALIGGQVCLQFTIAWPALNETHRCKIRNIFHLATWCFGKIRLRITVEFDIKMAFIWVPNTSKNSYFWRTNVSWIHGRKSLLWAAKCFLNSWPKKPTFGD